MTSFDFDAQMTFARLSGDYNPIHVDQRMARRLLFGEPIVHGIHLVLWALDRALPGQFRLAYLKASFNAPVILGEKVELYVDQKSDKDATLRLQSDGTTAVFINFRLGEHSRGFDVEDHLPLQEECIVNMVSGLATATGAIALSAHMKTIDALFPGLLKRLPLDQAAVLLATSQLVGMKCPGCHSVYRDVELTFSAPMAAAAPALSWEVTSCDSRFGMLSMRVEAPGASGHVRAFMRPVPVEQPSCLDLERIVPKGAFAGQRALVVGGSRGLGELTAKMLGVGGADVLLTYKVGGDDADRVVRDIASAGGKAAAALLDVCDVNRAGARDSLPQVWDTTHLYYFATPYVRASKKNVFSKSQFDLLCQYYVSGFFETVKLLRRSVAQLRVLYPSSMFVAEAPPNMAEFAAAKAAGELLCHVMMNSERDLKIRVARLPKMQTDQTASIIRAKYADAVEIMQGLLQEIAH